MREYRGTVVVLGYGPELTPFIRRYLDWVAETVQKKQPLRLIFSGGYTQQHTHPKQSEAQVMRDYVMARVRLPYTLTFLDEKSYTTLENVKNTSKMICSLDAADEPILFLGESHKEPKVSVIARLALWKRSEFLGLKWERGLKPVIRETISGPIEFLAFFFPPLAWAIHQRVLVKSKNR